MGFLSDTQLSNIDRIESSWTSEAGTTTNLCISDTLV